MSVEFINRGGVGWGCQGGLDIFEERHLMAGTNIPRLTYDMRYEMQYSELHRDVFPKNSKFSSRGQEVKSSNIIRDILKNRKVSKKK